MRSSEAGLARNVLRCRFVVVGSGIAGLWTARRLSEYGDVTIITKSQLCESNTEYAQGGIAVALLPADSPELHKQDTLAAGAGLCDVPAVEMLTREGPDAVLDLISIGARFDSRDGNLLAGREAAHQRSRVIHARGDATGAEVERAASEAVLNSPNVRVLENTFVTDLILIHGKCVGVEAIDFVSGESIRVLAGSTMMAAGGAGNLYRVTTNPPVTIGDAMTVAWRAGAALQDLEFVQFHPTALAAPGYPKFLISEAVRGEGAILRNTSGEAFMQRYSPAQLDLAPRDEVSRAVLSEMQSDNSDHVWLDLSPIGDASAVEARFPGIMAELRKRELWNDETFCIPVTPAAHYCMGGIRSDVNGQTSLPGFYACGEAASCGVHGANRLASNSLLDGLVFGGRSARGMIGAPDLTDAEVTSAATIAGRDLPAAAPDLRDQLRDLMWDHVGILRDAEGLAAGAEELARMRAGFEHPSHAKPEEIQTAMMVQAAQLIATAAQLRCESRGGHFRTDYPEASDEWRKHIILHSTHDGEIAATYAPVLE